MAWAPLGDTSACYIICVYFNHLNQNTLTSITYLYVQVVCPHSKGGMSSTVQIVRPTDAK